MTSTIKLTPSTARITLDPNTSTLNLAQSTGKIDLVDNNGITLAEQAALHAASSPSAANPFVTESGILDSSAEFYENQFSPLSIANCSIWLDASAQGLNDLDAVATAYDGSGNGNHFTNSTSGQQPIYHAATDTRPAYFDFDGSNDWLRSSTPTLNQPTTAFVIARFKNDYTADDTLMDGGGGANTFRVYRAALREVVFYAGANIFLDYCTETGWSLYTIVANGASSSFTLGNQTLTGSGSTSAVGITLGGNGVSTPSQYAACQIAAVALYSRALSADEIARVQNYFNLRYMATRLHFVGDSIVYGTGATGQIGFASLTSQNKALGSVNLGVGGTTLPQMLAKAPYEIVTWKKSSRTLNTVVIMGGTNDIALGATGAQCYANLLRLIKIWQDAGFRVVVVTMLPRTGTDTDRATYNTAIRNGATTYNYTVADAGGDALMGQNGQNNDTTYYTVDTVHPNGTGYARMANNYVIPAITWL